MQFIFQKGEGLYYLSGKKGTSPRSNFYITLGWVLQWISRWNVELEIWIEIRKKSSPLNKLINTYNIPEFLTSKLTSSIHESLGLPFINILTN